ncbi:MAG: hypothetical protein MJ218_01430 [Opitutales bacterium]|nr:hypothetical protein [Opitutales bacterium]
MTKRVSLLLALSIALGIHTPCYGLYVMVRSGFGELKPDGDVGGFNKQQGTNPIWRTRGAFDDDQLRFNNARSFSRDANCTKGKFEYKDHKNLSVALGGRFDVFDTGALGLELEILGSYTNFKHKTRDQITLNLAEGDSRGGEPGGVVIPLIHNRHDMPAMERPDFLMVEYTKWGDERIAYIRPLYLANQRIVGAQANIYWEQYILDWLSAGIGGGIGGAYVCTKMTTREQWRILDIQNFNVGGNANHYIWMNYGHQYATNRRKYVHSGSLLYNFTLFVRAEKFETLFEVGYRHIGLHQMFGAKCYGYEIPKLANLHSDQVYIGVGRTF